jgi:hypothetical protein
MFTGSGSLICTPGGGGKEKRSGQPAMNGSKQAGMGSKIVIVFTGRFGSCFRSSRRGAAAEESSPDRIPRCYLPFSRIYSH